MDLGLAGRRALVIGASQGLGRAVALQLAREGASVAITARRPHVLERVLQEMGGEGRGHAALPADMMAAGEPARLVKEVLGRCGHVDIVVHSIGGTLQVKDPLAPVEQWCAVWRLNVGIAIEVNGVLVPRMRERRWGRVVHISSISAESIRGSAPYASAKAALNAYVKGLGRAVAQEGIVVSGLMAGAFVSAGGHWDEIARSAPKMLEDFLRHHMALGRLGSPEELAPWVSMLCSEQASFAAGALVPIDGGTM